jgi:hypothetical protein
MLQGISCILSFLPIPLHFRYFHWVYRKAVLNGGCMGGRGSQEPNVRVNVVIPYYHKERGIPAIAAPCSLLAYRWSTRFQMSASPIGWEYFPRAAVCFVLSRNWLWFCRHLACCFSSSLSSSLLVMLSGCLPVGWVALLRFVYLLLRLAAGGRSLFIYLCSCVLLICFLLLA